jgi:hypothetical protein
VKETLAVIVVVIVLAAAWRGPHRVGRQRQGSRCRHYEQVTIAVSRADPEDFPGVLALYKDECG